MTRTEQQSWAGRIGANVQWSREPDRTARTAKARQAFRDRFEAQVDPDGVHPPEVRARMAESARKAHYTRLAYASAKARRAKRGGVEADA